jgi:two-component system response regulator AtoC
MQCLDWPGNIRELSNGIARHVVIGPEGSILEDSTRPPIQPSPPSTAKNGIVPLKSLCKEAIRASEKNIILAALRANRWNRRKAAQELKISYRLLIYKIRDAGLITKQKNSAGSPQEVRPSPSGAD